MFQLKCVTRLSYNVSFVAKCLVRQEAVFSKNKLAGGLLLLARNWKKSVSLGTNMIEMKDLPWPALGTTCKFVLTEDCLLSDQAFSNKADVVAKAGDTLKLKHTSDYGLASHPIHGHFRY
jgi:hypothetical protein